MQPILERKLVPAQPAAKHQEKNVAAENWRAIWASRITCLLRAQVWLSPALCKKETNSSQRETEAAFLLPGSHPLCFGINARHSLLSQCCRSPPWGPGRRSHDSLVSWSCLAPSLPCLGTSGASLLSLQPRQGHAGILYLSESCWKEPQANRLARAHIHRPRAPHVLAIRGVAVLYLPFLALILIFCC